MKRRTLLLTGAGALGALIVGWGFMPPRSRLGDAHTLPAVDGQVGLNGWIKLASDGTVLLAMNRSEMGQGRFELITSPSSTTPALAIAIRSSAARPASACAAIKSARIAARPGCEAQGYRR